MPGAPVPMVRTIAVSGQVVGDVGDVRVERVQAGVDLPGHERAGAPHVDPTELGVPRLPEVADRTGEVEAGEFAGQVLPGAGHAGHGDGNRDSDRLPWRES